MSSRRGEWLAAAFWALLGAAILAASWRMDRLGHQGISPWSAPGLLPGVVGALMVLFAAALALQLRRPSAEQAAVKPADAAPGGADGLKAALLAALICIAFAGISLGHGWPFQVEAAAFIFAFTAVFRGRAWRSERRVTRGLATTAAIALVAAMAIAALFERVFLVRLP